MFYTKPRLLFVARIAVKAGEDFTPTGPWRVTIRGAALITTSFDMKSFHLDCYRIMPRPFNRTLPANTIEEAATTLKQNLAG